MEYKEKKISDVIDIIIDNRGKNPEKYSEFSKYPVIDNYLIKNDIFPDLNLVNRYLNKDSWDNFLRGYVIKNDVLITLVGNGIGNVTMVPNNQCAIIQNTIGLRCNELMYNKYLYYALKNEKNKIIKYNRGSSQPSIRKTDLLGHYILVPDLNYQKKVLNFLFGIDKKIETNNKIIANLEAQAQASFKYYFIDFEPFAGGNFIDSDLGPIPKGWEVSNLEKIANYKNGVAIKKFPPKDKDNSLPALKIRELNKNSTDESSDVVGNYIDESVKVYDGDVIFSWSGTLLVKIWTGGDAGLNQHLFKVTSEKYDKWFYYLWTLYHLEKFISIARDKATTMGHIKRSHLKESNVLICDEKTYKNANDVLNPIIELIINLGIQNRALAQARDALLPRLMAGEIDLEGLGGSYD